VQWRQRADSVCQTLLRIQRPDGGFDIGYDFNFGRLHRKGESTSPELVGLLALVEHYRRFRNEAAREGARRAAEWVRKNAIKPSDRHWAIPYGPYSTKAIMVYNGTSFAAGALGAYLSLFPDEELNGIYSGMNQYLCDRMSSTPGVPGRFWFYSDQSRQDLSTLQREKIDYYHQMQQVEMHATAELLVPSRCQPDMIGAAAEHVAGLQDEFGVIPYTNRDARFGGNVHLWGFCSCAAGFLMAGKVLPDRAASYRARAARIYDWIYKKAWNGRYFYPVLTPDGAPEDIRYYVRSDAWVFNAFCLAVQERLQKEAYLEVCEKCYARMAGRDFSGIENHAGSFRARVIRRVAGTVLATWRRLGRSGAG
jgi:hypothetical protein